VKEFAEVDVFGSDALFKEKWRGYEFVVMCWFCVC